MGDRTNIADALEREALAEAARLLSADPDTSDEPFDEARRLLDAEPSGGSVEHVEWVKELIAAAPRLIAALLAERDADVSAGAVARTVAMSHIAAERDAERAARERAEAEARQLRELLHDVWLYIDWRYVTKQLTTEQKGMFADAVDEHTDGGYHAADRWWPAVAEGGEDAEDTE